jgi:hypothetical protein
MIQRGHGMRITLTVALPAVTRPCLTILGMLSSARLSLRHESADNIEYPETGS